MAPRCKYQHSFDARSWYDAILYRRFSCGLELAHRNATAILSAQSIQVISFLFMDTTLPTTQSKRINDSFNNNNRDQHKSLTAHTRSNGIVSTSITYVQPWSDSLIIQSLSRRTWILMTPVRSTLCVVKKRRCSLTSVNAEHATSRRRLPCKKTQGLW